jgi:hypothetical protein
MSFLASCQNLVSRPWVIDDLDAFKSKWTKKSWEKVFFYCTVILLLHVNLDATYSWMYTRSVLFMSSMFMCNCLICYRLSITVYAQMYNIHVNSKYDCVLFGSFLTYYQLMLHLYENIWSLQPYKPLPFWFHGNLKVDNCYWPSYYSHLSLCLSRL